MNDEKRAWPSKVFVPMLHYVKGVCSRRLSYRRAAKVAKGVLAAREALNFSMSRNKREEIKNVSFCGGKYMKRLIAIIFALMFLLCGCEVPNEERAKDYPKLEYQNSQWEYDSKDMYIPIPEGYVLNQGHAYEIVETEDGYDIILHMIKEE